MKHLLVLDDATLAYAFLDPPVVDDVSALAVYLAFCPPDVNVVPVLEDYVVRSVICIHDLSAVLDYLATHALYVVLVFVLEEAV
jgi:hypothetical protein